MVAWVDRVVDVARRGCRRKLLEGESDRTCSWCWSGKEE